MSTSPGDARRPVMLCILDGWGLTDKHPESNAVLLGNTPNFNRLWNDWPHTQLIASGEDVGLPAGVMGNSEVGHLNIGAGRIVWQDSSLIDRNIEDGAFFENENLRAAISHAKENNTRLHLIGLVSNGNVHSSQGHYFALLEMAARAGLRADQVLVHAFTDGRDVAPKSGEEHISRLLAHMVMTGVGAIASIIGRYYAMDRDNRWGRTRRAYELLTQGKGRIAPDAISAMRQAYARGETDEFVEETVILDAKGNPRPRIMENDSVIFFNYRSDRGRQLSRVFLEGDFDANVPDVSTLGEDEITRSKFHRAARPKVLWTTMTRYASDIHCPIAFEPRPQRNGLGETVSLHDKTQLRAAETEKYPHVTYFFSGGLEQQWLGEERILVPSPKVATYDLQPQMSEPELAARVCEAIRSQKFDLIILNFANPDMVGHTGVLAAAIKAVEAADEGLGQVMQAIEDTGGALLVIADHGNCEMMVDPKTGGPHTAHTTNPVPCILYGKNLENETLRAGGRLADVAPTLLNLLGLPKPAEMSGANLMAGAAGDMCEIAVDEDAGNRVLKKILAVTQSYILGLQRSQESSPLSRLEILAATIQMLRDGAEHLPPDTKLGELETQLNLLTKKED
jgi:2,3-bisphosphoglycerate-independent phosphoglycerate mutase